jgi:hypothetical protein
MAGRTSRDRYVCSRRTTNQAQNTGIPRLTKVATLPRAITLVEIFNCPAMGKFSKEKLMFDENDFDPLGYDADGYNAEGVDRQGFDRTGRDTKGDFQESFNE